MSYNVKGIWYLIKCIQENDFEMHALDECHTCLNIVKIHKRRTSSRIFFRFLDYICIVNMSLITIYSGASLIWTPLIRIIHLSSHIFGNQFLFLNRNWLTWNSVIRTVSLGQRCPDKWGSTVQSNIVKLLSVRVFTQTYVSMYALLDNIKFIYMYKSVDQ